MNQKKTIIYIGGFELPDKNAAAQRVLSNAKIFRELGFNVVFIGMDKTLPSTVHIEKTKSEVEGFEFWSLPYPSNKKLWLRYITSTEYLKYIITQVENVYAIVCYNYPALAQYRVNIMCKQKKIYCIADATEWYESSGGGILFNTIKWLDTNFRMRYVHLKVDGIITVSTYLTHFYKEKNCTIVELPTLYDIKKFNFIIKDEGKDKTVKLMYAGSAFNLERVDKDRSNIKDRLDKIISTLDKVYASQTNFILDIYGLTEKNYLAVFPKHREILQKLKQHIVFHGRQPHTKIIESIQKSDFTIFIRNLDRVIEAGFPSKFSESISYGTPVISNMISNIEPFIIEGKNGFILSLKDEDARIAQMITILKINNQEIRRMKHYCSIHKIFDYREYITPVNKFLQKLEG